MSSNSNIINSNDPKTIKIILKEALKSRIIKESKLSSKIFFSFIFIGVFTKFVFGNIDVYDENYGQYGNASVTIWSYGIIVLSIFCIIFLNSIINLQEENFIQLISKLNAIPMVILIVYLIWIISINIKHFEKLNMKKIPTNYNLYSRLSLFVILFQVIFFIINFLLYNNEDGNAFINNNKDLFSKINFINYILIILNFILIMIQQIILDNFSVDIL